MRIKCLVFALLISSLPFCIEPVASADDGIIPSPDGTKGLQKYAADPFPGFYVLYNNSDISDAVNELNSPVNYLAWLNNRYCIFSSDNDGIGVYDVVNNIRSTVMGAAGTPMVISSDGGEIRYKNQNESGTEVHLWRYEFDKNGNISFKGVDKWKTYRNEKYGFEVQYPGSFVVEEAAGQEEYGYMLNVRFSPERSRSSVSDHPSPLVVAVCKTTLSLEEWFRKNFNTVPLHSDYEEPDRSVKNIQYKKIGENQVIQCWQPFCSGSRDYTLIKGNSGYTYEFFRNASTDECIDTYNQMISTFKVLK